MLPSIIEAQYNRVILFVGIFALICGLVTSGFAQEPEPMGSVQASDMFVFGDMSTALNGAAILHTMPTRIDATIHTSGLDPHAAYTIWAIIFNQPANCTTESMILPGVMCSGTDLSLTPNLAEASAIHIGGFIANGDGTANVRVTLNSGTLPMGTDVLWGTGSVGYWWYQ